MMILMNETSADIFIIIFSGTRIIYIVKSKSVSLFAV